MEPITREQLQNLKTETDRIKKCNRVRNYVNNYYSQIKQVASSTTDTRHIIDMSGHTADSSDAILLELRRLFPSCLVEYRETRNMNNQVFEKGIIVDWS